MSTAPGGSRLAGLLGSGPAQAFAGEVVNSVPLSLTVNPVLLTSAERLRYQGYLRRQEAYGTIAALVSNKVPLKEIARRTGRSRNFVRQISSGTGTDVFRTRQSTLDGHLPFLEAQWTGVSSIVTEWATRQRRAEQASDQQLRKVPAARSIARLMTTKRDHLTKAETVTLAAIEQGVPMLEARGLVDRFQVMIRKNAEIELEPWINESRRSLIASFASGIAKKRPRSTQRLCSHGRMAG